MKDYQAFNVLPPLLNSSAMKSQGALMVQASTIRSYYLPSLFGGYGAGHWFTIAADFPENAGKVAYVAFGPNSSASLDRIAEGNGNTLCWPIPDGQSMNFRVPQGGQRSTLISTMCSYDWLHFCGTATGMLRIYRSSLNPGQGTEQFKVPL